MKEMKDLRKENPTNKNDLKQENMKDYAFSKGREEALWYMNLCEKNRMNKNSNITGKKCNGHNMSQIREEFCKRYFPELLERKKQEYKTYEEKMQEEFEALFGAEEKIVNIA